jgi:hypothetical protein
LTHTIPGYLNPVSKVLQGAKFQQNTRIPEHRPKSVVEKCPPPVVEY